jgi:5-methylcytosine-specific restriction enzyme subunit McrC
VIAAAVARVPGRFVPRLLPALREWEDRTFEGVRLSPDGRLLAARLAGGGESRLEVTELREGLRVRARSWVGVVRLDGVEIRVVPKLAGDQLGLVRLLELVTGLDGLTRLAGEAGLELAGESLLDLVALLFAESCQGVLRRGLLSGYVQREEALPMVRGRILPDRQVLKRFGQLDRIECRFDELEHDVDENRLLAAALRVAHRRVRCAVVRRRLARLRAVFDPICDLLQFDLDPARRGISYNRLNGHYEQAHGLAWMVLDGLGVDDLFIRGSTSSFAFLLDMNLLFERFVEKLVRRALSAMYRVRYQASQRSIIWDASANRPYARVVPDLLVEARGPEPARLAIDAKYKLYDERRLDPSDIYQTFLYAYSLGERPNEGAATSLILYPSSVDGRQPVSLQIRPRHRRGSAEIRALGISIPAALDEWEDCKDGGTIQLVGRQIRDLLGPAVSRSGGEPVL